MLIYRWVLSLQDQDSLRFSQLCGIMDLILGECLNIKLEEINLPLQDAKLILLELLVLQLDKSLPFLGEVLILQTLI